MADLRSTTQRMVVRTAGLLTAAFCCGCPMAPPSWQQQKIPSRWISVESSSQDSHAASSEQGLAREDVDVIEATVPTVVTLVAERTGRGTAVRGTSETEIRLSGTGPEYFQLLADASEAELARGRFLTDADVQGGAHVIVVDKPLAETLFGKEGAVGRAFRIGTVEFTVVGVLSYSHRSTLGDVERDAFIPVQGSLSMNCKPDAALIRTRHREEPVLRRRRFAFDPGRTFHRAAQRPAPPPGAAADPRPTLISSACSGRFRFGRGEIAEWRAAQGNEDIGQRPEAENRGQLAAAPTPDQRHRDGTHPAMGGIAVRKVIV